MTRNWDSVTIDGSMIYALVTAMLLAGCILIVGYAGRDANPGRGSSRNDKK